jgi:hypothetical protein
MDRSGPYGERSWRMFLWRLPLVWRWYMRERYYTTKPFFGLKWLLYMLW